MPSSREALARRRCRTRSRLSPPPAAFGSSRDVGLLEEEPDSGVGSVGVVSSEGTDSEGAFKPRSAPDSGEFFAGIVIPRKTQTAVEHSELLADLFAVIEEF